MSVNKARYFAFIVYPDSAPDDWVDLLKNMIAPFAISPLHSSDEEHSKPHYHVLYKHPNTVSPDAVSRLLPPGIASNDFVMPVPYPRGYMRYLCHLDQPEKEQFKGSPADLITCLNGFPLDVEPDLSPTQLVQIRDDIFRYIRANDLMEYADLLECLIDDCEVSADMLDFASNHTILFNNYLRSRRCRSLSNSVNENVE